MKKKKEVSQKNQKEQTTAEVNPTDLPKFSTDENGTLHVGIHSEEQRLNFLNTFGTEESKTAILAMTHLLSFIGEGSSSLSQANKINAALPMINAINPQDELEGMLALQMVGIHHMTMEMIGRGMRPDQTVDKVTNNVNRTTKLARTFIAQLDALNKHRGKGQQKMTVEHVHVNNGGQAVIGNIGRGRMKTKSKEQPHGQRTGTLKNGNTPCVLANLPRCNAIAKSTGERCKQPAMSNGKCYWHGGKSPGAPLGNQNAFKHGQFTKESKMLNRQIRQLLKDSSEFLEKSF